MTKTFSVIWALLGVLVSSVRAEEPTALVPFLDQHCLECHDDVSAKGGLDLLSLEFRPEDPENFAQWVHVFDRVSHGEMPPAKQDRPAEADLETFLSTLEAPLIDVARASVETTGRVKLRRLNRTEYEYSLRDLLGLPRLEVRERLPADGESHGFDTVGESLNLSYVQLGKYLETADHAIDRLLAKRVALENPPKVETKRRAFTEIGRFKTRSGETRALGETSRILLRQPNSAQSQWKIPNQGADHDGLHRISLNLNSLFFNDGEILPAKRPHLISIYARKDNSTRKLKTFVVPADTPETLLVETYMTAGETLMLYIDSLDDRNDPIANQKRGLPYAGSGIALHWIEVEGPLGDPAEQTPRLFDEFEVVAWSEDRELRRPELRGGEKRQGELEYLLIDSPSPAQDAARILSSFAEQAFRRPLVEGELQPYLALVQARLEDRFAFHDALRSGLKAILCSPDFLFLKEDAGALNDHEIAARLSYFLWKSLPDVELRALADAGDLTRPEVLREQTERLLSDPKSERFVHDYLSQWLELRRIAFTEPDRALYPEFTAALQEAMIAETQLYFRTMLDENLSCVHLIASDFTFANRALAELYDLPDAEAVSPVDLQRVALPAKSPRGGLLTQASILKITANGTTTSPVTRGVWINERLLGRETPLPPPGVGSIDPDVRGTSTIREQLVKHSSSESCASCHRTIDPPGFALESFDVIGGWRDHYRSLGEGTRSDDEVNDRPVRYKDGPPVDPSGETDRGVAFSDVNEFRALLLEHPESLTRNLAHKLVVYATGAGVRFSDRPDIDAIVETDPGVRDLIHAIVQSRLFLHK